MKALLTTKFFSGGQWTAVLATAALLAPAAQAQFSMGYEASQYQYAPAQETFSSESIGMRREQAEPPPPTTVAQPGMSPTWFGMATALDTMAALGLPDQVLAPNTVASSLRADAPTSSTALMLDQMRVQASVNAIDVLEARSVQFSGDTQAQLRDAMHEANLRRADLERSLAAAQNAGPNVSDQERSAVADDYLRYSQAAARVQQLASS
jgi:hypothetical protein